MFPSYLELNQTNYGVLRWPQIGLVLTWSVEERTIRETRRALLCIKGPWQQYPLPGAGTGLSVLLIWDSLGKASITGDVLHIKLPCCKAVAYTRSGCRFMLPPKQNEQCRAYLGFGGNEPFHHIDFLKHLEKKLCQPLAFGSDCDRSAHILGL